MLPMSLSELHAKSPTVDWLIDGILAKNTYGLITGSTGVGKTQLALQLAMCLAKGTDWDNRTLEKSRVLFGSHEMGHNELAYFMSKLVQGMALNEETDVLHVLPVGEPVSLLQEEGRNFYLQHVDKYDVFIFDTLSSSTHLSMLHEDSAPGIVAFFNMLTARYGKTVIAIGHDRKEAIRQRNARAEDMYGARLIMDKSSAIVRVEKYDEEHVTVGYPKVRLAKEPFSAVYARNSETLWLTRTSLSPNTRRGGGKNEKSTISDLFG